MNSLPSLPQGPEPGTTPIESSCSEALTLAIRRLPSVENQIEERAYQIYLQSGRQKDLALQYWLAAEDETRDWVETTITRVI